MCVCRSLKQAHFVQRRQRLAGLLRRNYHCPEMPEGYTLTGRYDDFYAGYSSRSGAADVVNPTPSP